MDPKDNQALQQDPASAPEPGNQEGVNGQAPPPDDGTPPESQLQQYEAVDEDGVPYRNRYAEAERKRIEAEAKAKAYEDFYARQQSQPQQPQQATEEDWLTLANTDFNAFCKKFRENVTNEVTGKINQTIKAQSEQRVVAAHPELLDKNSELSKQVRAWADTMRGMGIEPTTIPHGLESIVNTITRNTPKNGKPKPPPPPPTPPGGNQFFVQGKRPAKPQVSESKMPDEAKQLAKMMGLSEKSIERLEGRYAKGDFEIGGQ